MSAKFDLFLFDRTTFAAPAVSYVRGTSESLASASDSAARLAGFTRSAAQSLTTSDAPTRAFTGARTATQSLTTSDAATRQAGFPRTATQSLTTSDAATRVFAGSRNMSSVGMTTSTLTFGPAGARFDKQTFDSFRFDQPPRDFPVDQTTTVSRAVTFNRTATTALSGSDAATLLLHLATYGPVVGLVTEPPDVGGRVADVPAPAGRFTDVSAPGAYAADTPTPAARVTETGPHV